jgi:hypothetical protein
MIGTFPETFDSSMLGSFKSCPTLFKNQYVEHWKPKEPSVHLHAGAAFAKGIEVARTEFYVNGKSSEDAEAAGLGALLKFYGDFECPPDSAKSAERTAGALEFYFAQYPLNSDSPPIILPSGKHGIEFSFIHPLPLSHPETGNPLLYCGRMDAILGYAGAQFICDEKTTTSLGASWGRSWDLRAQFTGYAWGCQQAGIHVEGALIRGVSILKTKYDTQQAIIYRPEWQVDRWYDELLDWIKDIEVCWKKGKWRHNLDHSCADFGGCQFRNACTSQDEQPWFETYFERRHWDPGTRIETKL